MDQFPEAIRTITRTRPFHVTAVGFADSCLLRAIVASSDVASAQALPHGPAAELGTIGHDVLAEMALENLSETDLSAAIEALLEKHLLLADERLSKEPQSRRYANLRGTKTSLQWQQYKAALIRSASLIRGQARPAVRRVAITPRREKHGAAIFGVERTVTSEELDLSGRIDRIGRGRNGEIEIVDYKTKLELDASGDIPREVRTQLELYALLVTRHEKNQIIRLRISVFGGRDVYVPLREDWERERLDWLTQLVGRVPRHVELQAEELAVPSPNCVGCHIRHRCRSYSEAAPSAWKQKTLLSAWPYDIWGDVISVEIVPGSQLNILLRDAAGRLVRITGLSSEYIEQPINFGAKLRFFSLYAGKMPQTATATPHPTNFFEYPPDKGGRRAYSLAIFKE